MRTRWCPLFTIALLKQNLLQFNKRSLLSYAFHRPFAGIWRELHISMVISPNSTTTSGAGSGQTKEPAWLYVWLFAVNLQVVLLNLLIIINVLKAKSFQKSSSAKYFVLSLSISDLIVGLIVMPFGIISLVSNTWLFGGWWCELWQTFDFFACTASILNLCTVSIDR